MLRPVSYLYFALALMLVGCGAKGPLRAKLDAAPDVVRQLQVSQLGGLVQLGWTVEGVDRDGAAPDGLSGFRIKRLAYDAVDGCPTCRDPQQTVAEIDFRHPDPAQRHNERFFWRDLEVRSGSGYSYAVAPLTLAGQEGPMATDHIVVQPAQPAPTGLTAQAGDGQVTLSWPAASVPAEARLLGYNLYRSQQGRPLPAVPLNARPLNANGLVDRGLDNGRTYEYHISSVIEREGRALESSPGVGVRALPQSGR
jgi:hypothetical protein